MRIVTPKSAYVLRRRFLLPVALLAAIVALSVQQICVHHAEQRRRTVALHRRAEAVQAIQKSERRDFRGIFYPHRRGKQPVERISDYGEGREANTFLVCEKPLQMSASVQMKLADLHHCPSGQGACSYSGMVEIFVDDDSPIVVDVFGIGSNDANWFSVRDGMAAMQSIMAAMSDSPPLSPPAQEDFQQTIKRCWQSRHDNRSETEGNIGTREQSLQELGSCMLRAICGEWEKECSMNCLNESECALHTH